MTKFERVAGRLLSVSQTLVRSSNKLRKGGEDACDTKLFNSLTGAQSDLVKVIHELTSEIKNDPCK